MRQQGHPILQHKPALIGIILLFIIALFACMGPFLSGHLYDSIEFSKSNLPPSRAFWFGTDDMGRDLFTRVCYGARISLFVGMAAALIDMVIGVIWGSLAGFCGGLTDLFMMRLADILFSLPYLLVVILLLVILGPGLLSLLMAMTIIGWITMARIVRGRVLQIKEQDYILAAKALGARWPRVLFRHILPNASGEIIVTLTMTIPAAIFAEAFLSFLGLGIKAPMASWGTLASEGLPALGSYPWRLFFPAVFISATLLSFNLIGEGLRDIYDVKETA